MTDRVREILKEDCRNHGACISVDCAKECRRFNNVSTAIRAELAFELPKKFDSQDRSNEGFNRDYRTGYNQAIQDAQAKIREGGPSPERQK